FVAFDDARANLHTIGPNGEAVRRTDVSTGLFNPSSAPGGDLWALYHHSGQRVPVRIGANRLGEHERRRPAPDLSVPELEKGSLSASSAYKPLALRNWQFDNGMGILGVTGSGIYGQLYASASDRLRNHRLMLDLVAFGELRRTDGSLTYINQSNRIIWGLSLFQDFKFRVDETFDSVDRFISADRFYGARGILRYPFSQYTYLQMALAAGGVSYFLPGDSKRLLNERDTVNESQTDTYLSDDWHRRNSSPRAQGEAQLSFGFDNIHYQRQTGPLAGTSFLASVTGDYQPGYDVLFANARIDGETYLPVYKRLNLFFRLGSGAAFGDRFARQFFLSSFYTLRGVPFGDPEFLLGRNFAYSTLEFQFPLNFIVRVPFVDIEGIVGADFGGVGNSVTSAWQHRVFDAVAGFNFGFGPIVLRVHFAKPFDIGGAETPNDGEMVPNISVGWRYL
ncbi:MAG: tolB protein precursor protein, partial [Bradymonadaceae bacterium]